MTYYKLENVGILPLEFPPNFLHNSPYKMVQREQLLWVSWPAVPWCPG